MASDLGETLFERVGRTMTLTKAGEALIPYVEQVLLSVEQLRSFRQTAADYRGDIRVGVGETLLCYRIPPVIQTFNRQAPKARLFLQSMSCGAIRDALLDGRLDCGLFYEEVGGLGTASLNLLPMGRYPAVLVASPRTKARYPDFVTENQHIPLPLVAGEASCLFRQTIEGYLKQKSIRLDHTIELVSVPTIKRLVESDLGVALLPRFAVQAELDSGALVELETGLGRPIFSAVCACHKNKWVSPLMRLWMELCQAQLHAENS